MNKIKSIKTSLFKAMLGVWDHTFSCILILENPAVSFPSIIYLSLFRT